MGRIVHLFLDTNVLIQCKPLAQLDWSKWREAGEIRLIISRPVQSEIDQHKNKGRDRLARRARKVSSFLKEIITSKDGHTLIRERDPTVKLFVRPELLPDPELVDDLDYDSPDDRLVGIVSAFAKGNPDVDACLLTDDTGPMASARGVGVLFEPVPDEWLLPPEPSEADKRIQSLEAEVARLKETEPSIRIGCVDAEGKELERLDFEVPLYEALSQDEFSTVMARLWELCSSTPFASRFRDPTWRSVMGYIAPTNQQIEEYEEAQRKWDMQSEDVLRNLHVILQEEAQLLQFTLRLENTGSRPANNALVTILSAGELEIVHWSGATDRKEIDAKKQRHRLAKLPTRPTPPIGRLPEFEAIQRAYDAARPPEPFMMSQIADVKMRLPRPRDRNRFYLKSENSQAPANRFALECDQWRHGMEPEIIQGGIKSSENELRAVDGALVVTVHAENLTDAMERTIPVRIRPVSAPAFPIALKMVNRMDWIKV